MAVVLITGGTGDIGLAIARTLARARHIPVIAGRDRARADTLARPISGASGIRMDVTDRADCDRAVAEVVQRHGRVDGLVCAAAVFSWQSAMQVTAADLEQTFRVNVAGSLFPCQATAAAMIDADHGGSLVLLSSSAANRAVGAPAYGASKGAVESLTRELALTLAPHRIRVNAVSPGVIDSEMSREAIETPEILTPLMAHTTLGRLGRPDEVAATVAFLLDDAASYLTATVIPTDGGFLSR